VETGSVQQLGQWLGDNAGLAPFVLALLTFCESLPGLSFLVPATALLLGVGVLIGQGILDPWTTIAGAIVGAILGDAVGFWVTRWIGARAVRRRIPPARRRAYATAVLLMRRHGWWAVFFGRFLGPLRAIIPAAAGVAGMRERTFQTANVASAIVWAPLLLLPGSAAGWALDLLGGGDDPRLLLFGLVSLVLLWLGTKAGLRLLSSPRGRIGGRTRPQAKSVGPP